MLPRQGKWVKIPLLPENVGKRSLNYLGTLERVMTASRLTPYYWCSAKVDFDHPDPVNHKIFSRIFYWNSKSKKKDKINLDWLNLSYNSYKVKFKKLFLSWVFCNQFHCKVIWLANNYWSSFKFELLFAKHICWPTFLIFLLCIILYSGKGILKKKNCLNQIV